jgi:hypothetical protein
VFCAVYPANLDMVSTFHCVVGSQDFTCAPEGDPGKGVGIFEITPFLASAAHSYTLAQNLGLDLVGFSFDFDRDLLSAERPGEHRLRVAHRRRRLRDEITLTARARRPRPLERTGHRGGSAELRHPDRSIRQAAAAGRRPRVLFARLRSGDAVGVGSVEYSVTSACCQPDGPALSASAVDCTALQGQKMMMIDYGFLQSKAGE